MVKLKRKCPHQVILAKEYYEPQVFDIQSKLSPRVCTNVLIPVGCILVGTGIALVYTGGAVCGLAGGIFGIRCFGWSLRGFGCRGGWRGVDLGSGSARELSQKKIRANLKRLPPWAIQTVN